jgi:hypothetical protein
LVAVKAPAPSARAVDRFPPTGIRQEALAAMAARVAGKENWDSRARMAVRLDTFSRVTNRSDTVGAAVSTAPHVLVAGEEEELVVAVALVVALEEEDSSRRGVIGGAGSSAPKATPLPLVGRRLEKGEGQEEAVFPGSTADTDWLAESEVRRPDTRTSAMTTPWEPRAEVMSQRRFWWMASLEVARLALMATETAVLRVEIWTVVKVVCVIGCGCGGVSGKGL